MIINTTSLFTRVLIGICFLVVAYPTIATTSTFPESIEERRQEKLGSIIGNEGIKFKISDDEKITRSSTALTRKPSHTKEHHNYIWIAALDSVKFMPLNSADYHGGIIITDWIPSESSSTHRYKLSIYIKDKTISLDSFEVNVYGEEFRKGRWGLDRSKHDFLRTKVSNDILAKAHQLQVQNKRKK